MVRATWIKQLSVDKNIVGLLSGKTYEDFPGAIREMVSNAYDADATIVNISIDIENDIVEIIDNGIGMTPDEFEFFLRIAGQKTAKQISPELGRERIGQFGIGFLAIFPFGQKIKVISSALRSDINFEATIPSAQFFQRGTSLTDVEEIPIPGQQTQDNQFFSQHGTTIQISGLTKLAKLYFRDRNIKIVKARNTIKAWSPWKRLIWNLQENLPLDYPENSALKEAFSDLGSSGISVYLNNQELFRNSPGSIILENKNWDHNDIKCRYVIATDWKSIIPDEEKHLKQRLKNVGIGERVSFGLGIAGRTYSRLHWLTGEIRILDGMDSILSIDRSKFIDSPEYDKFTEFFRGRLSHFAHYVEDVAEAERDIKRQLTGSRVAEVGSKKIVIQKKVKTLESKGFKVEKNTTKNYSKDIEPIKIDIDKKVVEIVEEHPAMQDVITISGSEFPIRYIEGEEQPSDPYLISRDNTGTLIINSNYPLFKSRRYGEMLKKSFVVLYLIV